MLSLILPWCDQYFSGLSITDITLVLETNVFFSFVCMYCFGGNRCCFGLACCHCSGFDCQYCSDLVLVLVPKICSGLDIGTIALALVFVSLFSPCCVFSWWLPVFIVIKLKTFWWNIIETSWDNLSEKSSNLVNSNIKLIQGSHGTNKLREELN